MKICIIGAGWYGSHLALVLSELGYDVTLVEKNSDIFEGISGNFGIRLHAGPHYPRSIKTRENCQRWFSEFCNKYKDLIIEHNYAIYALGNTDSDGLAPKVDLETFKRVCSETFVISETEKPEELGYSNLQYIANVYEPSVSLGKRLRDRFRVYLEKTNIEILCDTKINALTIEDNKVRVLSEQSDLGFFDYAVNTTSYQYEFTPFNEINLPFNVKYQCCLALVYKDTQPESDKPFSFIVLDGSFPCMMPYADEENNVNEKYILTHGKWTILGSFNDVDSAYTLLHSLDKRDLKIIRRECENSIKSFWPAFEGRFEYLGWKGTVLAKLVTDVEFRSAVTYATNQKIIHVVPGKVTNVFDVGEEVIGLINSSNDENVINENGYSYLCNGVLHSAMKEIIEKPKDESRNTCSIQTYKALRKNHVHAGSKDDSEINYRSLEIRNINPPQHYCDYNVSFFSTKDSKKKRFSLPGRFDLSNLLNDTASRMANRL